MTEDLAEQCSSPGDLPSRAIELILLVVALELLEIERRSLFHQPDAGEIAVGLGEQAVEEGTQPTREIRHDGKTEFERYQPADPD